MAGVDPQDDDHAGGVGTADEGTRDHELADRIASAEGDTRRLADCLCALHEHAEREGAEEHAELYDLVASQLSSAAKSLGRARDIMAHGCD